MVENEKILTTIYKMVEIDKNWLKWAEMGEIGKKLDENG